MSTKFVWIIYFDTLNCIVQPFILGTGDLLGKNDAFRRFGVIKRAKFALSEIFSTLPFDFQKAKQENDSDFMFFNF